MLLVKGINIYNRDVFSITLAYDLDPDLFQWNNYIVWPYSFVIVVTRSVIISTIKAKIPVMC